MSDGGAQFYSIGPLWDAGNLKVYSQPKLHHYAAGTSNDKDIWEFEDKTGALAQPFVAGTDGKFNFYADGDYKFVVTTSADASIDTYDNVKITSDTATMWEGNWGVTVPAATVNNQGQMFAEHEATTLDFEALHINHGGGGGGAGPAFLKILDFVGGVEKKADLILGGPRIDVRYYDAVGDGITDDSAAIQNAATAIPATGGTLYFPKGTYLMTADIDIVNKPCHVTGDGIGQSIIQWSSGSDYGIDFDSTNVRDSFQVDDISLYTDVVDGGDAINANWPIASLARSNCLIRNVEIAPTIAAKSTAYFTNGIVLLDARNCEINNATIVGKDNDQASMTSGIHLVDTTLRAQILGCNIWYSSNGVLVEGTCDDSLIKGNNIQYANEGIVYNTASVKKNHKAVANIVKAFLNGISCTNVIDSTMIGNSITKHASSTEDFTGILVAASSGRVQVEVNSVRETGTSGTDTGILIDGDDCLISNNFIEDQNTGISSTGNNNDINGNKIKTVTTGISTTGDKSNISGNTISATTKCITFTGDNNSAVGNLVLDAITGIEAAGGSNDNHIVGNKAHNTTTDYLDSGTGNRWPANHLPNSAIQVAEVGGIITLPNIGELFEITGSGSTNIITASWEGRLVTLYKRAATSGTFTILDDVGPGNVQLVADVAIAAKTTLTLRASSDGNWYQVSASVN